MNRVKGKRGARSAERGRNSEREYEAFDRGARIFEREVGTYVDPLPGEDAGMPNSPFRAPRSPLPRSAFRAPRFPLPLPPSPFRVPRSAFPLDSIPRYRVILDMAFYFCHDCGGHKVRIGKIAAQAEVSVQTVRFYERKGLIRKPRRLPSGYRDYPAQTVGIIQFIKRNQDVGFTLNEILGIIRSLAAGAPDALNRRQDFRGKISALDKQIQALQSIRDNLSACLDACICRDGKSPCPGARSVAEALRI
jgi:DNA-binding transcriptional MerR regulator